jgi:uncharacterized protein (TIGR02266 family)
LILPDVGAFEETQMPINATFSSLLFGVGSLAFFLGLGFVSLWVSRSRNASNASGLGFYPTANLPQRAGKETRKEPRVDVNWAVSIDTPEGFLVGEMKNVSLGGAFVCCKKPLPLGEVFRLRMIAPDGKPITANAEVIWSNASLPDAKVINRGMGIRLTRVSDRYIRWVHQMLQEYSQNISPQ